MFSNYYGIYLVSAILGSKKIFKICRRALMSFTYQRNRSIHVVDRTGLAAKCTEKRSCKACRKTVFHGQLCKVVTFWSSSSCLLKFHKDRVLRHDHAFSFLTQLIMHNYFYHADCFTHARGETPLASNSLKAPNSIAPGSMGPILITCSTAAETLKQTAN